MEYFDIVDEQGMPTGETVSRDMAHSEGILHRTAHVWIVRKKDQGYDILLQKRSMEKDSFPGQYDTSSAGHIPAGDEPLFSALRELKEELGIDAEPEQLHYAGSFRIRYEKEFHRKMFRDNEVAWVYVYSGPVDLGSMVLQESELDEVRWFDLDEVWNEIKTDRRRFCVPAEGLNVLKQYLRKKDGPDYAMLTGQLQALIETEPDYISVMSNASALLMDAMEAVNWAGFYLVKDGKLKVCPFQGKPACVLIDRGRGVCGTAWEADQTIVVPDVHDFPGHIACDSTSRSEIVIPVHQQDAVAAVLDIDSPERNRFSEEDRKGLERFVKTLESSMKFF